MTADGHPVVELAPLAGGTAPGLPSYSDALNSSGQHDAPPPPYSRWVHTGRDAQISSSCGCILKQLSSIFSKLDELDRLKQKSASFFIPLWGKLHHGRNQCRVKWCERLDY